MKSLNKVQLIGNLGDEPKMTTLDSGSKVVRLSLATNEDYVNKGTGEIVKNTGWHTLTAWNKTAELIEQYTKKGDRLYVEGKLVHTTWEGEKGEKKYGTEVRVLEFMSLTKKETAETTE